MTPPEPPQPSGGRALLRGRLGPIPVHLDISFVVFVGLLGFVSAPDSPSYIVQFVVIGAIAVLLHELGHAVTVLVFGGRPAVALTGLGGLTSWTPHRDLRRWEQILISAAGPGVGLALWPLILFARRQVDPVPGGMVDQAFAIALFTTLGWSLLNLVPMLPLDGGQILRELLPGGQLARTRRALGVSVAIGVVLAVLAWRAQYSLLPVMLAYLVVINVLNLRALPTADGRPRKVPVRASGVPDPDGPPLPEGAPPQARVVTALWQGRAEEARRALESASPPVDDLAVHGAVLAVSADPGEAEQGAALLRQEVGQRPDDEAAVGMSVLVLTLRRDWAGLSALFDAAVDGRPLAVGANVAVRALQEAWRADDLDAVARLAGAALYRSPTRPGAPAIAYLAALASIASAARRAGPEAADEAARAAAVSAWAAFDGVPLAREYARAALWGGASPDGSDLGSAQRPLLALSAFGAARAALASAAQGEDRIAG
ncbi:MAG: hypothetical protein U0Q15_04790 [Kineosporiaceae bacterium]